jgi:tetratricopeptide (TPR) repeat protein
MEHIEKLREKVEKDPSSTLFVPLADEYRKAGQMDEAINVLKEGIERQPGYMSARVALGKIYLEKDMTSEAKEEFEKVVVEIPDNLFAQKKLAEIYMDLGEKGKAITQYKMVLELNPLDEEAQAVLGRLEGGGGAAEEEVAVEFPSVEEPVAAGEAPEAEEVPQAGEGMVAPNEETSPEAGEAAPEEEHFTFGPSIVDEEETGEEGGAGIEVEVEGVYEEALQGSDETWGESDLEEMISDAPEIGLETGDREAMPSEAELKEADSSIDQGDYVKALDIYENILENHPENREIMQRVGELKSLLKLLGKGNEVVETRLKGFLERIKARGDEFFERS